MLVIAWVLIFAIMVLKWWGGELRATNAAALIGLGIMLTAWAAYHGAFSLPAGGVNVP